MLLMSLDCEYNQPSGKTIQIGAAVFNVHTNKLTNTFEIFVNPNETITQYISELTGILDKDVENSPNIQIAFQALKDFHAKNKVFVNPLVWGSGARNDSLTLWKESGTQEENFMGYRVIDVKTIYQSQQIRRGKKVAGGLKTACENEGIGFEGAAHTALADAINTYRLWYHLTERLKS